MDEYAEEKRTEKNSIVRSGISEAETTNNKRLHSTFRIGAIQTRSVAWLLCDSRASCYYVILAIAGKVLFHLSYACLFVVMFVTIEDDNT